MESTPSHAQSGTASKARARAMSDHTMIGSLGKRSTSTPANRPKSANGSASSAVRTPISSGVASSRSEEHTSELQSHSDLVCRLLLEKKKQQASKANVVNFRPRQALTSRNSDEWATAG